MSVERIKILEREPQDHSLEDLLVRSEESPCENTDAPRAPAKSSSQTPTEIVSPIVSPASEAISQKLCFQPKSKAASGLAFARCPGLCVKIPDKCTRLRSETR